VAGAATGFVIILTRAKRMSKSDDEIGRGLWLGEHSDWFLRSTVVQLLSTEYGFGIRCLITDLARLVAEYMTETTVLAAIWSRPHDARQLNGRAWQLTATSSSSGEPNCVLNPGTKEIELKSNYDCGIWNIVDSIVDNKRRIGYLMLDLPSQSHLSNILAVDLVNGRHWLLGPLPTCHRDRDFGLSLILLCNSLWIIGKQMRNHKDDKCGPTTAMRYDLNSSRWDPAATHTIDGISCMSAFVEITQNLAVISGGYRSQFQFNDSCRVLEENAVNGGRSVLLCTSQPQLPSLLFGRAHHQMAFVSEADAITSIEGMINLGGTPEGVAWSRTAEVLSIRPFQTTEERDTRAWAWHRLTDLPAHLGWTHKRTFGVGDNVVVNLCHGFVRLRICGNCALDPNSCAKRPHSEEYTKWQPLTNIGISDRQALGWFWLRESSF
jgi:hypothetical protein